MPRWPNGSRFPRGSKPWHKEYVPLEMRRSVPAIHVKDLKPVELVGLVEAVRYEHASEMLPSPRRVRKSDITMTEAEARAEINKATRQRRLVLKWHRGFVWAWYAIDPWDREFGMCRQLIMRYPRPSEKGMSVKGITRMRGV